MFKWLVPGPGTAAAAATGGGGATAPGFGESFWLLDPRPGLPHRPGARSQGSGATQGPRVKYS